MPSPIASPLTSTSSRLPPPRSPAMPSAGWKPRNDAERRIVGLLAAGQHADLGAENRLGPVDEIRAVLRLAGRGGRQHIHAARRRPGRTARGSGGTPPSRASTRLGIELAGRDDAAAEAGQHLFVEQHGRRARQPLIDDETDRVRPDVDDRQRSAVLAAGPAMQISHQLAAASAFLRRLNWAMRLGACDFSASPRPERLGLVMKYSCALNGSSPSSSTACAARFRPPIPRNFAGCP